MLKIYSRLFLKGYTQKKIQLIKQQTLKSIMLSAVQGFMNPLAYYLILFKAYSILPAQVAQPVNFIWPLVLMLLSAPLLKQPIRTSGIIALLISLSGVFILATQGNFRGFHIDQPSGIALCIMSSVIWSLFWILNIRDKRDDLLKLFLSFMFSMFYILIIAGATNNIVPLFKLPAIPAIYIGMFEMGFSFVFWMKALQLSESTGKVANMIYLTPFLSLVVIHFVLHETLHFSSIIGLCFITGGILLSRIKSKRV
jgi:drug/metabolite transporter (DMT)-like permease